MPYYAGGDLRCFIARKRRPEDEPSTEELDCLAIQVLRAVGFLHENDIAHGDIRPEHILLTARGSVKLGGFGEDREAIREIVTLTKDESPELSVSVPNPDPAPDSKYVPTLCMRQTASYSSVPYLPPERFPRRGARRRSHENQDIYDFKAGDIWACGVICMLLRSGRLLWLSAHTVHPEEAFADYLRCRLEEDGYGPIQALRLFPSSEADYENNI
ncbi:kinase-like domain-containing protein [Penicillium coprophilum]|uniref:kinase-like domain-containing protein n=1 Tax=Penicillium coprophilum TaxID=36646 RepID=UPI0023A478A1|nr:kinase-like domain-containing protein [Penicillium coprophilum]KAJ5164433.1 kinase-like domain-containing protein [Penicillium coprophilum]